MNALEILTNEHGLIRQYLDNLAVAVEKIENGQKPPREFFELAVDFARNFADKHHHFKEEHVMFVRLAQKHNGTIDGQIESLRHQHERGRSLVAEISNSLDGFQGGDAYKTEILLESLAAYIALLRHHIPTEDHVFYPLVKSEFTAQEMDFLREEFEKAQEKAGATTFEESHKQIVDMGSMLVHM